MKRFMIAIVLAAFSMLVWALPTTEQVEQAVQRGDYAQAETMMREVVAARPGSAKAHYVYAELLARNGNFAQASEEARRAGQIDPQIRFTDPAEFRAFEQSLDRAQRARVQSQAQTQPRPQPQHADSAAITSPTAAPAAATRSDASGVPGWMWIAGLALLGIGAWKLMSPRRTGVSMPAGGLPAYGPMSAAGTGGMGGGGFGGYGGVGGTGFGNAMPGAGMGPGMQATSSSGGLLRTGAAVAGGVAAGMLVDRMLNRSGEAAAAAPSNATPSNNGGLEPGLFGAVQPDTASAELASREVDLGRGDDWDAGSIEPGGAASDSSDGDGW